MMTIPDIQRITLRTVLERLCAEGFLDRDDFSLEVLDGYGNRRHELYRYRLESKSGVFMLAVPRQLTPKRKSEIGLESILSRSGGPVAKLIHYDVSEGWTVSSWETGLSPHAFSDALAYSPEIRTEVLTLVAGAYRHIREVVDRETEHPNGSLPNRRLYFANECMVAMALLRRLCASQKAHGPITFLHQVPNPRLRELFNSWIAVYRESSELRKWFPDSCSSFCKGDAGSGNVLVQNKGVVVFDFEFSGRGPADIDFIEFCASVNYGAASTDTYDIGSANGLFSTLDVECAYNDWCDRFALVNAVDWFSILADECDNPFHDLHAQHLTFHLDLCMELMPWLKSPRSSLYQLGESLANVTEYILSEDLIKPYSC